MEEKLRNIISFYEKEEKQILRLIKFNIKEGEYQLAHFHQKALAILNKKLQSLHNLQDKYYDGKEFLNIQIRYYEMQLKAESSDYMQQYFAKKLKEARNKLEDLNQLSNKSKATYQGNNIDQTLFNLIHKKIKSFDLILNKSENFIIHFKYSKNIMIVTLPLIRKNSSNYTLHKNKILALTTIGFKLNNEEEKIILALKGNKEIVVNKLKQIISKIVFEMFYFKEFENESFIKVNNKSAAKNS